MLWESMEAELPSQWKRSMGESPVTDGEFTVIGHKWCEVAHLATDSENNLSRPILSQAINSLRKRQNKAFLPSLGEFEDLVMNARRVYRQQEIERKNRDDRSGQLMIGDIPMTQEQVNEKKHREFCNRLMLSYITNRYLSRYRKREALRKYLKEDPERNQWHGYIRALAKQKG